jgi:hypothetical protein
MIKIFTILPLSKKTIHYYMKEDENKAKRISCDKWFKLYDQIPSNPDIKMLPPLTEVE